MIGGQALDILSENLPINENSEKLLDSIHNNKTGRLLSASVLVPSCLANNSHFDELINYGKNLGLLFQITDDILDFTSTPETLGKSVNKDQNSNKLTFVTLYGIDTAKNMATKCYENGVNSIKNIEGSEFLVELLGFVKDRSF